jgi:hypothetical protein
MRVSLLIGAGVLAKNRQNAKRNMAKTHLSGAANIS